MPRIARVTAGGIVQHVLNRGNGRTKLFNKPADYAAFVDLLADALERVPGMRLTGFCLMPNHWHLVLWPREAGDLPEFMRWLSNTHARRFRSHSHSVGHGHVYQGRYKSFLVQNDAPYLTLLRFVEANPLRAKRVKKAEKWPWSSLATTRSPDGRPVVSDGPTPKPAGWKELVNQPTTKEQTQAIRTSIARGRPFGDPAWVTRTAAQRGLASTLRNRGRPPKVG